MRAFLWKGWAFFLLLSCTLVVHAESLSFEPLFQEAVEKSWGLKAQSANTLAADAGVEQAGKSPNPILSLQTQTDDLSRVSQVGLFLSQPIELGGKRGARVDKANAQLEEAQWVHRERLRNFRFSFRENYNKILLAQQKAELARELLELTEHHLTLTEKRLESGDVAGVEVSALQAERERRAAALGLAEGRLFELRTKLSALLERPESDLVLGGQLGVTQELPEFPQLLADLQGHSGLGLAEARADLEAKNHRLEKSRAVSDLTLSLGLFFQRDLFEASAFQPRGAVRRLDDTATQFQFQIQVPLPLNDDNSGAIKAAQALHQKALLEKELVEQNLLVELRSSYRKLQAHREARRRLETEALPRAREALVTLESAYRLGFRSQIDLLMARESYLRSAEDALSAAFEESMAWARLEAAAGQRFPLRPKKDEEK